MQVPVIVSVAEAHFRYLDVPGFVRYLRERAAELPIPVVIHLDHGTSLTVIRSGLELGFSSVMIDGSALPYAENAALTKGGRESGPHPWCQRGSRIGPCGWR